MDGVGPFFFFQIVDEQRTCFENTGETRMRKPQSGDEEEEVEGADED